jgi:hypothetical protein
MEFLYPAGGVFTTMALGDNPASMCCEAYLIGQSTDILNQDACATSYANYAYSAAVCTADLMPVHPSNSAFVATAITTGETRPDTECCIEGINLNDPLSTLLTACVQTQSNHVWDNSSYQLCTVNIDAANPNDANTPYRVSTGATVDSTVCCSAGIAIGPTDPLVSACVPTSTYTWDPTSN